MDIRPAWTIKCNYIDPKSLDQIDYNCKITPASAKPPAPKKGKTTRKSRAKPQDPVNAAEQEYKSAVR